ncbi:MAG TPA: hypothetical protein VEB64_00840, partial [Azospirillaceae bacterium]|nr:hypothetical protein [Azospirillaceae bacterium]
MPFTTGVRGKIVAIILFSTLATALAVSTYVGSFIHTGLMEDAEKEAMIAISRSANMFMVSTIKFQKQYEESKTPEAKKQVLEDWVRTIVAVDDAVVHDFGTDTLRVRLIGDTVITKLPPQGGKITAIERPFEREALTAFAQGRTGPFSQVEDDVLRVAVPLPSDIHAGCATCHGVPTGKRQLLGSLNAYIPLAEAKAAMWSNVGKTAAALTIIAGSVMTGLYLAINRLVLKRVKAIGDDLATLPEMGGRTMKAGDADELEAMARAITVLKENLARAKALEAAQESERHARQQRAERIEDFIRGFDRSIASVLETLGESVKRLHGDAETLAATADQTSK